MKAIPHPKADPQCEACNGVGYLIVIYDDGEPTVQRCDQCLYSGPNNPVTVWDTGVAPYATESGIECDWDYPCYVRNPEAIGDGVLERRSP